MSAFRGNPEDICSHRVLLSLTLTGPWRFKLRTAGNLSVPPVRFSNSRVGSSALQHNVLSLMSSAWRITTMQFRVRKAAHLLERVGLAMAGAACGLFVAVYVGSSIAALTSQFFLVVMMISGAIGFYLGIDTPPLAFHGPNGGSSKGGSGRKIDTAEFLSAVGTFLATLTAFVSVGVIVLRENPHIFWTAITMVGWVVGLTMQIIAGAVTRTRT
jgi:hypothetical protein